MKYKERHDKCRSLYFISPQSTTFTFHCITYCITTNCSSLALYNLTSKEFMMPSQYPEIQKQLTGVLVPDEEDRILSLTQKEIEQEFVYRLNKIRSNSPIYSVVQPDKWYIILREEMNPIYRCLRGEKLLSFSPSLVFPRLAFAKKKETIEQHRVRLALHNSQHVKAYASIETILEKYRLTLDATRGIEVADKEALVDISDKIQSKVHEYHAKASISNDTKGKKVLEFVIKQGHAAREAIRLEILRRVLQQGSANSQSY